MKKLIIIILFIPLVIFGQEKTTTLPTAESDSFTWKAGNGEYVDVQFSYLVSDEVIEKELLDKIVMSIMVQSKFKLKNKNSYMPKKLTIIKSDSGFSAMCKYTGKNAYGTDLESTTYFSFENQGDGNLKDLFTR